MDEAGIAAKAVALVAPYVAKGAEELAKKVGGEVGGRVVKLWDALSVKLQERGAGKALANLEAKPEDARRQAALELELEEALAADEAFRRKVAALIEAVPERDRTAIQQIVNVTGDRNITVQTAGTGNRFNVGRR